MNVKDIDKKLDMKLRLVISENADIFRWSMSYNINMGVFIRKDITNAKNYYFEAFIMKNKENKGIKDLIEAYSPMETGNFYMVSQPVMNKKILDLLDELWNVPSILFRENTIENGKLILRMRFHSHYKQALSLILNKYLVIPYFIEDILLVESQGFTFLLDKKNKREPLSIIQYSVPVSTNDVDFVLKVLEENNGIAQVVENPQNKDNSKLIVFLEKPIEANDKFTIISEKNNIYQAHSNNKLLDTIKNKANVEGIFRNDILIKIKNGRIYSTSCISTNRIMEYVKMIFSSSLDLYGQNLIKLEYCSDFDSVLLSEL